MATPLDVLIATYRRSAALAVTLASLCAQSFRDFRLIISNHQELPTTVADRRVDAPHVRDIRREEPYGHG